MGLRPLGDRVVLKITEQEDKTKGGIVLPDTAREKPQRGEIVAIGSGKLLENGQRIPVDLKVGDRVIFSRYAGTEVKVDGEEYLIVDSRDILAIVG